MTPNTEFLNKMHQITENTKNHIAKWDNKEIGHSNYWSNPTAVMRAIAEFGAENIFMVSSAYHGKYEDDYASFTYYNNKTGEYFHDEWTTAFACPSYNSYECTTLKEAFDNGLVNLDILFKWKIATEMSLINRFNVDPFRFFDDMIKFGMRVEVKRGRKWKGIGFLVGQFSTCYTWDTPRWTSRYYGDNGYGRTITNYAKIFDPTTNTIYSINRSYCNFLDLDKFVEEYKEYVINELNSMTPENLEVGARSGYSPYSGDSFGTPITFNKPIKSFMEFMTEKHTNHIDTTTAIDVVEEAAKKKYNDFREKKLPGIITWVRNNTDKTDEGEILELAEHIFKKHYGDK